MERDAVRDPRRGRAHLRPGWGQPLGPNRSTRTRPAGTPRLDQQLAGRLGEPRRSADVARSRPARRSGASSAAVEPAGRPPGRRAPRGSARSARRRPPARRRRAARPGCARTRPGAAGPRGRARAACRSIATSGTTPVPPADAARAGVAPSQTNQPPIGPRTSSSSPDLDDVGEVGRHLAVGEPLDVELDQRIVRAPRPPSTSAARCSRPRRAAGRRSAGRAGGRSGRGTSSRSTTARGWGGVTSRRRVAVRQPPRGSRRACEPSAQSPW